MRYGLPKKTQYLWQLRVGMVAVVLLAAISFLCFASPWFLLLTAVFALIFGVLIFWYVPKYLKSYLIELPEGSIIINRGVFINVSHIMPYSRLVYCESFSTPLAKAFGLSAVTLKAARSLLVIPELPKTEIERLIGSITEGD